MWQGAQLAGVRYRPSAVTVNKFTSLIISVLDTTPATTRRGSDIRTSRSRSGPTGGVPLLKHHSVSGGTLSVVTVKKFTLANYTLS